MRHLKTLREGDQFTFRGSVYSVISHEFNMTEVEGNGRRWAWPIFSKVKPKYK